MKNRLIILISFLAVIILFSACPSNVENTPPEYTITIADIEHGSITSVIDRAVEGAEVVLTVVEEAGYRIKTDSIVVNMADRTFNVTRDAEQKTRYFFKMPTGNVTIQGEFIPISTELESLSILSGSGTELVKNFDSEITDYTVIAIDAAPVAITVTGTPAYIDDVVEYDINSSISSNLHFGENTVAVTVKSSRGGAFKEYTIRLIISDIPILFIDTANRAITSKTEWLEDASVVIYNHNNEIQSSNTDIKGRGNTNWYDYPKKSYSLKLSNKVTVLGMPEHKRWALLPNYADKTLLRTDTAFELGVVFDKLSWTPRSEQIALYLNNEYWGVYQLTEAIKIDTNRVAISNKVSKKKPDGGYILEIDIRKGEEFNFTTTHNVDFCLSDPDEDLDAVIEGDTRTVIEKIQEDVQYVEDVLYSADFTDNTEGYRKYIDVDSFIDWYLVQEITKNVDARFAYSVYMYYDPDKQKYCMGPLWDFDFSMGNLNYTNAQYAEGFWIKDSVRWVSRFFEDPSFVALVKARWNAKKNEVNGIFEYIDQRAVFLRNAQALNFQKWDILNIWVSPNPAAVQGSWQGYIDVWKLWLSQRLTWLDAAINAL